MTAFTAELITGEILTAALRADRGEPCAAGSAELLLLGIVARTFRALHVDPPSRGLARYTSEKKLPNPVLREGLAFTPLDRPDIEAPTHADPAVLLLAVIDEGEFRRYLITAGRRLDGDM